MVEDVEYVIVTGDAVAAEELSAILDDVDNGGREISEIHGLGGSIGDWMIAGTLALHAVSRLLKAVYPYVEGRRIASIKAGDVEILRPRPEDVGKLLDGHFAKEVERPGGNP
ncbi:hypothetical protein [Dactylosporangium matsuzakiense]|uniref:Uncharacterized protein n=1 Tax=Dactylosporangium matsuzakiense TaxID=53360 RepID=A0A9W6NTS0_9ACTN|nr:hypothetical protein [Dactylosporangium matsuzakiense]UWZ44629.1 hypothetical protein Dmats_46065 [Dactylosporangium matsuzakiense]GLL08517.1 hypothetical protein GCM10017581_102840 [Dactylosporangium matsuzakiense]